MRLGQYEPQSHASPSCQMQSCQKTKKKRVSAASSLFAQLSACTTHHTLCSWVDTKTDHAHSVGLQEGGIINKWKKQRSWHDITKNQNKRKGFVASLEANKTKTFSHFISLHLNRSALFGALFWWRGTVQHILLSKCFFYSLCRQLAHHVGSRVGQSGMCVCQWQRQCCSAFLVTLVCRWCYPFCLIWVVVICSSVRCSHENLISFFKVHSINIVCWKWLCLI